ncbi:MAG: serine hydrolase domain-containing protein [Planctomycetota bacterium]
MAQPPEGQYIDVRGTMQGPLGERVQELIDVINSGRRVFARAFVDEHLLPSFRNSKSMEEHLAWFAWTHARSRGFDNYGIRHFPEAELETEIFIILRNHLTDAWEALSIEFENALPYRISGMEFFPTREPSQLPPPKKLTHTATAQQLEEHVKKLAGADVFSGVVLLAKDGKPLLKKAFGLADRGSKTPNRTDTKFDIGSMSVMFTGVAIAQLAERGKLSYGDKVVKYLSADWLPSKISKRVTIRQLLTHTSGMGDELVAHVRKSPPTALRTLEDYRPYVANERYAFEPAKHAFFSHAGFVVLGAIVEKVTGKGYCEYVRDKIFKPAGMSNTGCIGKDAPVANLAIPYSRKWKDDAVRWTKTSSRMGLTGGAAGGVFSTVEDILKFDIALRGHKLLKANNTNLVLSPKPDANAPEHGYGFAVRGERGKRVTGQVAKGPGGSAELDMYLDAGYTSIVLSNYDGGSKVVADKFPPLLDWPNE